MGGLIVQKLVSMKRASLAVAISPAPPKGVFSFKWSFLKLNLATINPILGDSVCLPTFDWFHEAFCNTLSKAETREVYDDLVVPESRNIPRSSTKEDGAVALAGPHVPLLFVYGERDTIIPHSLVEKNISAYTHAESIVAARMFPDRTHFLCGQKGWEQIADFIAEWLGNPRRIQKFVPEKGDH